MRLLREIHFRARENQWSSTVELSLLSFAGAKMNLSQDRLIAGTLLTV